MGNAYYHYCMSDIHLIFIPADAAMHQMTLFDVANRAAAQCARHTSRHTSHLGKLWCHRHLPQHVLCLSHKNGAALLAAAPGTKPGVDLEVLRKRDVHGLMAHVGSKEECDRLARSQTPLTDFYRGWTMKEALIKAEDLIFPTDMKRVGLTRDTEGEWHLRSTMARDYLWLSARLGDEWLCAAVFPHHAAAAVMLTLHQPYGGEMTLHDINSNAKQLIVSHASA